MKLSNLIDDFKKHVNDLNEDMEVEVFDENLAYVRGILNNIDIENNRRQTGYYIAVNDIGPDDDFTRYYTPIGRMTRGEALVILDALGGESEYYSAGWGDHLEQVSEKTYAEWYALAIYSTMLEYSKWVDVEYHLTDDELRPIEDKVLQLRKHLGLSRRWEEVELYRR